MAARKFWLMGMFLAFLAPVAAAQQGTIAVPAGPLAAGSTITIGFSNPALAGQTVTIDIDGATLPEPEFTKVEITLDASGKGSVEWTVPGWFAVSFNGPGAYEVTRIISLPPGDATAPAGSAAEHLAHRHQRRIALAAQRF